MSIAAAGRRFRRGPSRGSGDLGSVNAFRSAAAILAIGLLALGGCGGDRMEPVAPTGPANGGTGGRGVVIYLDGAGGGNPLVDWGEQVKEGLRLAGYGGAIREYEWQTRLGALADQWASERYKRDQARQVAERIVVIRREHPGEPLYLMALSAGTAVAVFALEALPPSVQVTDVVLLSSSMSADYDLTRALQHVRGRMYVTLSHRDDVLKVLVPLFGTADRQFEGRRIAGLQGFAVPAGADERVRRLYCRIEYIRWTPRYGSDDDFGAHLETTVPEFIANVVAPRMLAGE